MRPRRGIRPAATVRTAVIVSVVAACLAPAAALEGGSAAAVETAASVERTMALEQTQRYSEIAEARVRGARELATLYRRMDALVADLQSAGSVALADLVREIEAAERERESLLADQRTLVSSLVEHLRRAELLEDRVSLLRERDREAAGPLAGEWEVVMLPNERRGVFSLRQSGTLVTGTYRLEGGWTGSLQGTLVNRKVFLVRIDSRLGRTMEFEGRLSEDGSVVRGSWLNYDLSAGGGSEGQWTATRVDE